MSGASVVCALRVTVGRGNMMHVGADASPACRSSAIGAFCRLYSVSLHGTVSVSFCEMYRLYCRKARHAATISASLMGASAGAAVEDDAGVMKSGSGCGGARLTRVPPRRRASSSYKRGKEKEKKAKRQARKQGCE